MAKYIRHTPLRSDVKITILNIETQKIDPICIYLPKIHNINKIRWNICSPLNRDTRTQQYTINFQQPWDLSPGLLFVILNKNPLRPKKEYACLRLPDCPFWKIPTLNINPKVSLATTTSCICLLKCQSIFCVI